MQESHMWNDRLDLDDAGLDEEHHLQIAMIGALAEAIEQRRPWLARRLGEQLATYSAAHFGGEQLVMEASKFPDAAKHRDEHQVILNHIGEVRELLQGGEFELALPMALDLLTGIGSHISSSDRAVVQHTSERRRERAQ
jgi:hemerythrin